MLPHITEPSCGMLPWVSHGTLKTSKRNRCAGLCAALSLLKVGHGLRSCPGVRGLGGSCYRFGDWSSDIVGRRRRSGSGRGVRIPSDDCRHSSSCVEHGGCWRQLCWHAHGTAHRCRRRLCIPLTLRHDWNFGFSLVPWGINSHVPMIVGNPMHCSYIRVMRPERPDSIVVH